QSRGLRSLRRHTVEPLGEGLYRRLAKERKEEPQPSAAGEKVTVMRGRASVWLRRMILVVATAAVLYAAWQALTLLREVHGSQFVEIMKGALATFLRVNVALVLAAAWTIPAGVAIGFHPRLARIAQPIAQIAASVPATALLPVLLIALVRIGGGMGVGSFALMLLGTQWYILFNVSAGGMAIPSDRKEVATLFHFTTLQKWKTVILP